MSGTLWYAAEPTRGSLDSAAAGSAASTPRAAATRAKSFQRSPHVIWLGAAPPWADAGTTAAAPTPWLTGSYFVNGASGFPGGTNHVFAIGSHLAPSFFASSFSRYGHTRSTRGCEEEELPRVDDAEGDATGRRRIGTSLRSF